MTIMFGGRSAAQADSEKTETRSKVVRRIGALSRTARIVSSAVFLGGFIRDHVDQQQAQMRIELSAGK
jgi:hypothetical protein